MAGTFSGRVRRSLVAATLLTLGPLLAACGEDARPDEEATVAPAWSDGRTVWWGQERVETGQRRLLRSFTTTQDAVVWIARDGGVWAAAPGTPPEQIGSAGRTDHLVADRFGSLVAWVDVPDVRGGAQATLVVHDTGAGESVLKSREGLGTDMRHDVKFYSELEPWPPRDKRPLAMVLAVDDQHISWVGTDGLHVTDVETGRSRLVETVGDGADEFSVLDTSGSQVASWPFEPDDPESSPPAEVDGVEMSGGFSGLVFSPDGRHVIVGGEVDEVAEGDTVLLPPEGMTFSQWVDARTVAGLRYDRRRVEVVACPIDGAGCRTVSAAAAGAPLRLEPSTIW